MKSTNLKSRAVRVQGVEPVKSRGATVWEFRADGDSARVVLRGQLDERTELNGLSIRFAEPISRVLFDLSEIHAINSWGARQWILFVRSLPDTLDYGFERVSPVFVKHCNMIADMSGRGRIESFYAPYVCDACGSEAARLLQSSALSRHVLKSPPLRECPTCRGQEQLDDIAERYFAFLFMRR